MAGAVRARLFIALPPKPFQPSPLFGRIEDAMNAGSEHDNGATREVRRASIRRARRPRRFVFACVKFTGALFVLTVLAAGILVIRMNAGPIPIEGLGNTIAAGLQDKFGNGLRFSLGGTSLVQHGFGPSLSIDKLKIEGPDGTDIMNAPRAEISIDPFALLFGKVKPKRLEVFDVTLRAALLKNGDLAIAAGGAHPFFELGRGGEDGGAAAAAPGSNAVAAPLTPPDAAGTLPPSHERAAVMRKAAAGLRQFIDVLTDPASPIAAVDRLGISGGTLVIQDQETDEETIYKNLDLSFDKRHGVSSFGLSAEGPARRWSISAMARGRPGAERRFALKMQNLTIDELRYAAGSRSVGLDTDMPIGMHLDIGLRPDNTLLEASGGVDLGRGFLRLDDPDFEPAFMDAIDAGLHWNGTDRTIVVDKIGYVEGDTRFKGAGRVVPPLHEGEPWLVDLALAEPALLAPARKGEQAIPIDQGEFRGRLDFDAKTFFIDRLSFKPRQGGVAAAGAVDWINGPRVRLGISMDPTPVAVVKRIWPASVASAVRAWCLNHFEAGLVSDGTLKIDYDKLDLARMRGDRAPSDASVNMDFKVTGGRLRYLDGVPPLDDVTGTGHVTGRTTHLLIDKATTTADGHTATLTNGTFVVLDSNVHPAHAAMTAHLSGPVETVTSILARDALKPYASLPLDPATLHGQIDGDLGKAIVLGEAADPSQEALTVDAKVTNFTADRLIGKESLENATLTIKVGDGTLRAEGQGHLYGGTANFDITKSGEAPPAAVVSLTLDDAARAKLGLNAIPGFTGPITAHVNTTLGDPQKMKAQVELDLAKTGVAAAFLGLSKPAGRPARVAFTLASGNNKMSIDALTVDVGSLQAKGAIDLGADNSFQAARFSSFKVSPGDDMKLDVSKGDDTFRLVVRGSTIDARPFLKALTSTPGDSAALARNAKVEKKDVETLKGFDIDLKSNILTGFNKEVMSGVELKLSKRKAQIRQFSAQGRFGRQQFAGSMTSAGRMKISAMDAGALLSFIDLYKHMEGGRLASAMQLDEDTLSGSLEIQDFVLRDEPAIRRLVATSTTESAPGENQEAARRIDGGAVDFKRLKVNFQRDGSRLDLRDATMYGPQIGLSVDGWLDYSHDRVGMKGTFVPAFAVNNLFSQIPVFGAFLGGKSNEGLLAITFNISGAADSPSLTINPLSVIAPGFLRNIFGVLDAPVAGPPPATR